MKKIMMQQASSSKKETPKKAPAIVHERITEETDDNTKLIKNVMSNNKRVLIGVPTLGIIRMEWAIHRHGQTIPINFQVGTITVNVSPPSVVAMGYSTADAQNVIVEQCIKDGYEWCFLGDTIVETDHGSKKIRDISAGEMVKTHKGRYRKVTGAIRREIKQRDPLVWVKTKNSTIKCTPGHPFLVSSNQGHEWKEARHLSVGDLLLYPDSLHREDAVSFDVTINPDKNANERSGDDSHGGSGKRYRIQDVLVNRDVARVFGFYLAEGHSCNDYFGLTFHNDDHVKINLTCDVLRSMFFRTPKKHGSWATQVRLSSRSLAAKFREWFGEKSTVKRVPGFVFQWSLRNRLEFLLGYLECDGSNSYGGKTFTSASKDLIDGIVALGESCGLCFSEVREYRNNRPISELVDGEKVITGRDYDSGNSILHCRLPSASMAKAMDLLESHQRSHDGYAEIAVYSIENKQASALKDSAVYNLEVEEDNSYIAGCTSVHNCLLWEDDTMPPFDALMRMSEHMERGDVPIVSGLYFTKGNPSWPLVFRGRGNGCFRNWKMGDLVWVDGFPTGFIMIHGSILHYLWENSPTYKLPDGTEVHEVFKFPRDNWFDPEENRYFTKMGTSDLHAAQRIIEEGVLEKTGWKKVAKRRYPFLIDTRIACQHISLENGAVYPQAAQEVFWPTGK